MKYLEPFNYRHRDGGTYLIECAVEYQPATTLDPMKADCTEDLQYQLEVTDLCILNVEAMDDVTDLLCNQIPDQVFIRELELELETQHSVATLPEKNIWDEAEHYYGQ